MGTWRPLKPIERSMKVCKNLNKGAVQTVRSARPHRKQPVPRARVPGTRLLGRVGPSLGPGMRGGGARMVSGQRCRGRNALGVNGEQGVDPIWLVQKIQMRESGRWVWRGRCQPGWQLRECQATELELYPAGSGEPQKVSE